jgi:hypothetical protein
VPGNPLEAQLDPRERARLGDPERPEPSATVETVDDQDGSASTHHHDAKCAEGAVTAPSRRRDAAATATVQKMAIYGHAATLHAGIA